MKYFKILYESIYNLIDHDGVEHAGYMSFLTILSFFPFLVFITALTSFFGNLQVGAEIINAINNTLPADLTNALLPRIDEIKNGPPAGLLTISILGAIWTASSSFEGIRTILNRVYHVKTKPNYIFRRISSIIEFFFLSLFLILGTTILYVIPYIIHFLEILTINHKSLKEIFLELQDIQYYFTDSLRAFYIFCVLFFSLILIYYHIPNIKLRFKNLIPGTFLVIVGWSLCAQILKVYISNFDQVNLIYGSLGGIIASLLFFFFVHLILIWGAEFNYLYGHQDDQKQN
jgi:membrane protein